MRLEVKDFTDNISEVMDFVTSMKATGGDDAPEDVLGGLDSASKLSWTEDSARFLVLIADAPMHGKNKGYHSYSSGYPENPNVLTSESTGKRHSLDISSTMPKVAAENQSASNSTTNVEKCGPKRKAIIKVFKVRTDYVMVKCA